VGTGRWFGATVGWPACSARLLVQGGAPPYTRNMATSAIDHLVYATPDLDATVHAIVQQCGVHPTVGGQHLGLGTRNALLALGAHVYLEIVGPDPEQPPPNAPRWFQIDTLDAPRLVTWCASATDLMSLHAHAHAHGVPLGAVRDGGRVRPDGVRLAWQVTSPFTVLEDGLVPFFIDWLDSAHPADSAPQGASLVQLLAEHPSPEALRAQYAVLGVGITVRVAAEKALVATIEGPRGRFTLR
jgi:hypothetical protein